MRTFIGMLFKIFVYENIGEILKLQKRIRKNFISHTLFTLKHFLKSTHLTADAFNLGSPFSLRRITN